MRSAFRALALSALLAGCQQGGVPVSIQQRIPDEGLFGETSKGTVSLAKATARGGSAYLGNNTNFSTSNCIPMFGGCVNLDPVPWSLIFGNVLYSHNPSYEAYINLQWRSDSVDWLRNWFSDDYFDPEGVCADDWTINVVSDEKRSIRVARYHEPDVTVKAPFNVNDYHVRVRNKTRFAKSGLFLAISAEPARRTCTYSSSLPSNWWLLQFWGISLPQADCEESPGAPTDVRVKFSYKACGQGGAVEKEIRLSFDRDRMTHFQERPGDKARIYGWTSYYGNDYIYSPFQFGGVAP